MTKLLQFKTNDQQRSSQFYANTGFNHQFIEKIEDLAFKIVNGDFKLDIETNSLLNTSARQRTNISKNKDLIRKACGETSILTDSTMEMLTEFLTFLYINYHSNNQLDTKHLLYDHIYLNSTIPSHNRIKLAYALKTTLIDNKTKFAETLGAIMSNYIWAREEEKNEKKYGQNLWSTQEIFLILLDSIKSRLRILCETSFTHTESETLSPVDSIFQSISPIHSSPIHHSTSSFMLTPPIIRGPNNNGLSDVSYDKNKNKILLNNFQTTENNNTPKAIFYNLVTLLMVSQSFYKNNLFQNKKDQYKVLPNFESETIYHVLDHIENITYNASKIQIDLKPNVQQKHLIIEALQNIKFGCFSSSFYHKNLIRLFKQIKQNIPNQITQLTENEFEKKLKLNRFTDFKEIASVFNINNNKQESNVNLLIPSVGNIFQHYNMNKTLNDDSAKFLLETFRYEDFLLYVPVYLGDRLQSHADEMNSHINHKAEGHICSPSCHEHLFSGGLLLWSKYDNNHEFIISISDCTLESISQQNNLNISKINIDYIQPNLHHEESGQILSDALKMLSARSSVNLTHDFSYDAVYAHYNSENETSHLPHTRYNFNSSMLAKQIYKEYSYSHMMLLFKSILNLNALGITNNYVKIVIRTMIQEILMDKYGMFASLSGMINVATDSYWSKVFYKKILDHFVLGDTTFDILQHKNIPKLSKNQSLIKRFNNYISKSIAKFKSSKIIDPLPELLFDLNHHLKLGSNKKKIMNILLNYVNEQDKKKYKGKELNDNTHKNTLEYLNPSSSASIDQKIEMIFQNLQIDKNTIITPEIFEKESKIKSLIEHLLIIHENSLNIIRNTSLDYLKSNTQYPISIVPVSTITYTSTTHSPLNYCIVPSKIYHYTNVEDIEKNNAFNALADFANFNIDIIKYCECLIYHLIKFKNDFKTNSNILANFHHYFSYSLTNSSYQLNTTNNDKMEDGVAVPMISENILSFLPGSVIETLHTNKTINSKNLSSDITKIGFLWIEFYKEWSKHQNEPRSIFSKFEAKEFVIDDEDVIADPTLVSHYKGKYVPNQLEFYFYSHMHNIQHKNTLLFNGAINNKDVLYYDLPDYNSQIPSIKVGNQIPDVNYYASKDKYFKQQNEVDIQIFINNGANYSLNSLLQHFLQQSYNQRNIYKTFNEYSMDKIKPYNQSVINQLLCSVSQLQFKFSNPQKNK